MGHKAGRGLARRTVSHAQEHWVTRSDNPVSVSAQANGGEMSVAQLNSRIAAFAVTAAPPAAAAAGVLARAWSGPLPPPSAGRTRPRPRLPQEAAGLGSGSGRGVPSLGGRSASGPLPSYVARGGVEMLDPCAHANAGMQPAIRLTAAHELAMRGITVKAMPCNGL